MTEKLDKILDRLGEQAVQLARIEERLLTSQKDVKTLKREVDSLKRFKWTTAGALAALSFGAQYILKHMVK
jgi:hypothetical protein